MFVCDNERPDTFLCLIVFACITHWPSMCAACAKYSISFACVLVRSSPAPAGFQRIVKRRDPFSRLLVELWVRGRVVEVDGGKVSVYI